MSVSLRIFGEKSNKKAIINLLKKYSLSYRKPLVFKTDIELNFTIRTYLHSYFTSAFFLHHEKNNLIAYFGKVYDFSYGSI